MKNKKISIIVPIYNSELFLEKCIESIINQTYSNLEIILIDDGSKDNSLKIMEEYAKKDKRILIKHIENQGVSHARNVGLDIASGDYILFLDSDDYIDKKTCEKLINYSYKTNSIIRFSFRKVDSNYKILYEEKIDAELLNSSNVIKKILCGDILTFVVLLFIPKGILKKIRFSEKLVVLEDKLFYLELFKENDLFIVEDVLYNYYTNSNSAVNDYKRRFIRFKNILIALEIEMDFLITNNLNEYINNLLSSIMNIIIAELYDTNITQNDLKKYVSLLNDSKYKSKLLNLKPDRIDRKIVVFLLKHNRFTLLYVFLSFIRLLKKIKRRIKYVNKKK